MLTSTQVSLVADFESCIHNTRCWYGASVDKVVQETKGSDHPHSFDGYCICMTPEWVKDVYTLLTSRGIKPEPFFEFLAEREWFKKGADFLNAKRLNGYGKDDAVERDDQYCLELPHLIRLFREFVERSA